MGQRTSLRSKSRSADEDSSAPIGCDSEQIRELAPPALILTDPAGVILSASHCAGDLFGYTSPELIGRPIESLLAEGLPENPGQPLTRPFGSRLLSQGRHRDGHEIPVSVTLLPLDADQEVRIALLIDECDATVPAAQLVHREHGLRQLVENTSAVVYVKDLDGRYLLVNAQFELLFHLQRDQIRGRTDFDLFPAEMAQAFRENDLQVARTGQTLRIDEVAPLDDGPHTYVSVKFPMRDETGTIYAVAGISTDITDRVRAEVDAAKLRSRLEVILNSISNGIVGMNGQGDVTFANPTAQRLLQADASSLGRLMPSVVMDVATRPTDTSTVDDSKPVSQETRLRRADGTSFHAELQVYPVVEQGLHRGAVVSFRDVTDRKRREAIERQVQSARAVQQILYPKTWPSCPGLDIAGHVYSADTMCGDYLDFIRTDAEELTIAVGDVSGHGFGPALQMVETRACLRAMLKSGHSLADSVTALNRLLIGDIPTESFITLFTARIDLPTLTLTCVTAGHVAWLFREGSPPRRISGEGLVLGIDAAHEYAPSPSSALQAGDVLLLPTDGVQETQNVHRELFGIERMLQTVAGECHRTAVEIVDALYHATIDFAGQRRQSDDVTIAVVKVL